MGNIDPFVSWCTDFCLVSQTPLGCTGTLSGKATLPFQFSLPFLKGSTLNGKNLLLRSKFFPSRVEPILKGLHRPGKKTEITKVVPLFFQINLLFSGSSI